MVERELRTAESRSPTSSWTKVAARAVRGRAGEIHATKKGALAPSARFARPALHKAARKDCPTAKEKHHCFSRGLHCPMHVDQLNITNVAWGDVLLRRRMLIKSSIAPDRGSPSSAVGVRAQGIRGSADGYQEHGAQVAP